jgi:lysine-specific demethylase 9
VAPEAVKSNNAVDCNGSSSKVSAGKIFDLKDKPTIQNASKDSLQFLSTKKDPPLQKPALTLPVILSPHKVKTSESAKKPDSTFIKVDYLKPEKTKENVARVLDFASSIAKLNGDEKKSNGFPIIKVEKDAEKSSKPEISSKTLMKIETLEPPAKKQALEVVVKKETIEAPVKKDTSESLSKKESTESSVKKEIYVKKESSSEISIKHEPSETSIKKESKEIQSVKPETVETPSKKETSGSSSSKHHSSSSTKSSTHHHSSSSHHKSHSSSHHKSSSHRSSSKDCSRCYRRSKIKRATIGIQVRPEESTPKPSTRQLEFEASHRVGVNRKPVAIKTNMSYLKFGRFYHIEVHPNGGASIVHMYQDELDTLSQTEMAELVDEFFELVFSEDENGFAFHVMGVVHDGARYLPDLLEHMAENYSNLTVKSGVLGRNNDIETCTMLQYYEQVMKSYDEGTVRHGPLHQISLVGKVHEEVGGYFPDLLGKLEASPFLKKSMPWGKLSVVQMDPRLSNDGPILWIRPGEQLIPTAEMTKTPLKKARVRNNELRYLQYLPRTSEAREIMFEDRTKAHADHVGMGHERQTTAAVGKINISCPIDCCFTSFSILFRCTQSCSLRKT